MVAVAQPRFGVWAVVYGSWGPFDHPADPVDASWERNRRLIVEADRLGFDSTLIAQHVVNPFGDELDQLETWTSAAALAALTERIEIIAAIKPYLVHPVVLAKQALQIQEISGGRFGLNLVNAWYKPELARAGVPFAEHDERYEYGREWISVVRGLLAGERVSFEGKHFQVDGYQLRPAASSPTVYVGGESDPARALVADKADVWFINGQPKENVAKLIADVAARPRAGAPVRFGLSAFVVARETDVEAEAELAALWDLAEAGKARWEALVADADPKAVMFQTFAKYPHIGTNGGTAAGLVGSYDTVAQRIREWTDLGIETFMLQFQPFEAEMRRFAEHVLPRVRLTSSKLELAQ
ncbi:MULTISPECIES: LLM class flavin-dependent oxidoreductase [Amycolatopsis]|uniref:LLM class flavin-dependent oxidoreductase n=1 Tax=Amycolatopsis TaxID=1813 RepID=UPI0007E11E77|nr:LLM class flavin-dependent oxidoreductase [Amycolatopsis sp. M39]OAP28508.1 Alkanesulfonate monooxygenase [Amycolatopsis sp. M39]